MQTYGSRLEACGENSGLRETKHGRMDALIKHKGVVFATLQRMIYDSS